MQKQIAEVHASDAAALTAVQTELKREITDTRNELAHLGDRIADIESCVVKEREKQKILDGFRQHPNLFAYYHTTYTTLEEIFIGSKSAASCVVNVASGQVATVEKAVSFFGGLAQMIPVAGGAIKTTLGVVSVGLQKINSQRQNNTVKYISSLVTLPELMEVTELVARKLTSCYARQIRNIATLEDMHSQQQGGKAKAVVQEVKQKLLKAEEYPPVRQFAEFGVLWIVDALMDMEIDPNQPIHDQLVSIVITHKSPARLSALKEHLLAKCGVGVVPTRDGKTWHLCDMYIKCGVETEAGALYANNGPYGSTDTITYGYCLASEEIAETRGLLFVGNRHETATVTGGQTTPEKHAVHAAIASQGHKMESMEERLANLEKQTSIATIKDRACQSYAKAKTHIKLGENRAALFALDEAKRLYKQLQKDHSQDASVRLRKIEQKTAALSF